MLARCRQAHGARLGRRRSQKHRWWPSAGVSGGGRDLTLRADDLGITSLGQPNPKHHHPTRTTQLNQPNPTRNNPTQSTILLLGPLSSLRARTPVATGPTSVWRATPKPSDEPRQASDAALWQAHRTPPASKGDRKVRTRRLPSPRRARLPALCVAISLAHTSGRQPTANPTPVPAPTAEGLSCKGSGHGRHGWEQRGGNRRRRRRPLRLRLHFTSR